MLKKTSILTGFTIILLSAPLIAWQSRHTAPPQAEPEITPNQNIDTNWSKNATEEETARLIKEAELLLNNNETKKLKDMAAEVLSSQQINSKIETTRMQPETTDSQHAELPIAMDNFQNEYYAWVPGLGAVIVCVTLLIMVKNELKRNRKAAIDASQLISEISELQMNIKEWELENHYSHISEISEHIDALKAAANLAKNERLHIDTSINNSIELNKKSLDILKRANKELSKSLVNQVQQLEEQLVLVIAAGIDKVNITAEDHIRTLNTQKTELMSEMNSKISAINTTSVPIAATQKTSATKPQQNWMDVIKSELKNTSGNSSGQGTHSAATLDHVSMLRESIERQKTILNQHNNKNKAEDNNSKSSLSNFFDGLKSSNLTNEEKRNKKETTNTKAAESIDSDNENKLPAEVELEAITTENETKPSKSKATIKDESPINAPDENKLFKKLEHAQKWHHYADAAEICSQLAEAIPANADVYDIWGQMLARHAAEIKGNEGTELLKLANKKMHKASMLNSSNYKTFNNWGVILKNLALTYSNTHEAEKTLALARRKFETSISLNPSNHEALSNWGNALVIQARYRNGALQESLLQKACEKFDQAIKLKNDKASTLHSWGNALFRLANCKKAPQERNYILQRAHEKWQHANKLKPGIASKELRVIKSMVPPLSRTEKIQKDTMLQK